MDSVPGWQEGVPGSEPGEQPVFTVGVSQSSREKLAPPAGGKREEQRGKVCGAVDEGC